MISIVAHGIMGTAYRQDVVVDGGVSSNGSLHVLRDIRRQLSSQYGDDTPMTGWALVPASNGMWLSRIERAFDANYAPAYVTVSFLIPHGQRFRSEALQLIENRLTTNHAKYIQQNVVLYDADWSFLHNVGRELEGMMEFVPPSTYRVASSQNIAYWPGDIYSMIDNIWDERFGGYSIIYCGKRILASGKEYTCLDDKLLKKLETQTIVNMGTSTTEPLRAVNDSQSHPLSRDEVLKNHKKAVSSHLRHVRYLEENEEIARRDGWMNKTKLRILLAVSAVFAVLVAAYIGIKIIGNDNKIDDKTSVNVVKLDKRTDTLIAHKDPLSESNEIPTAVDDESQSRKKDKQIVRNEEKSRSIQKIKISSQHELFYCLAWDNVKDGGAAFYEKYEVDERFRPRINTIIRMAQKIGRSRYNMIYSKVAHQTEAGSDKLKLKLLEKELFYFSGE